jgi:hypothetical protein
MPEQTQKTVRVNMIRDLTIRDEDGGVVTYGPGLVDVPPRVAYTLSLRPEYIATDGTGVPLKDTIEQLAEFGTRHVHAMPAPDVSYAKGEEFDVEPIERTQLAGRATGADRQGGRLNAVVGDSPLLDEDTQHHALPGQRSFSPAQRTQLTQDVHRAEVERDSIARDQGQNPNDVALRISEHAQGIADDERAARGKGGEGEEAASAFKRFAGDSETHESSEAHGGAYQTEGGEPIKEEKTGPARKRSASKRSGSKRSSAKRGTKRSASKRASASDSSDDE